jgi:ferrochelatase
VLVLPAYPQYSATTTASVFDAVYTWGLRTRQLPELRFVNHYHDHPGYIQALAAKIQAHWAVHGRSEQLVMSFHGVPARTLQLGDPYHCECHKTARLLAEALQLPKEAYKVCFQSRFGKAKWLEPYTEPTVRQLAKDGTKSVDIVCPGFVGDCLETLEEIAMEVKAAFLEDGGSQFHYIECLNDSPAWIEGLHDVALQHMGGWDLQGLSPTQQAQSRAAALAMGADD